MHFDARRLSPPIHSQQSDVFRFRCPECVTYCESAAWLNISFSMYASLSPPLSVTTVHFLQSSCVHNWWRHSKETVISVESHYIESWQHCAHWCGNKRKIHCEDDSGMIKIHHQGKMEEPETEGRAKKCMRWCIFSWNQSSVTRWCDETKTAAWSSMTSATSCVGLKWTESLSTSLMYARQFIILMNNWRKIPLHPVIFNGCITWTSAGERASQIWRNSKGSSWKRKNPGFGVTEFQCVADTESLQANTNLTQCNKPY